MHRLLRPLLILIALVFLFEAWLWRRLAPLVAWTITRIPLRRLKAAIAVRIDALPPAATLSNPGGPQQPGVPGTGGASVTTTPTSGTPAPGQPPTLVVPLPLPLPTVEVPPLLPGLPGIRLGGG